MFRIVCDPSSGSTELCFTEITLSGSQIFFVSLVGVLQRNFETEMCVYGTTGWELVPSPSYLTHTHTYNMFLIAHDPKHVGVISNCLLKLTQCTRRF